MSCAVFIPGYSDYSSAKKYYKKGQFDLAASHLTKSLTLKPNNKKAIQLFELSYINAVDEHQLTIKSLSSKKNKSKCMLKIVVHKLTDKVLGCHMFGETSSEIIQMVSISLNAGAIAISKLACFDLIIFTSSLKYGHFL